MKRVHYLTNFILMFYLPCLLSAQIPKKINSLGGESTEVRVYLDTSCNLTYKFFIEVANLDLLNQLDCIFGFNNNYTLPLNYPTMKLKCTLGDIVEVVDVDFFTLKTCNPGYSIFRFSHEITINLADECYQKPSDHDFDLTWSVKLLDDSGAYYPFCNYTSPGDIFACDVFSTPSCFPYDLSCNNRDMISKTGGFPVECDECSEVKATRSKENSNDENEASHISNEQASLFVVNPNPFNDQLQIQWNSELSNPSIQLYSLSGQLVKSWSNSSSDKESMLSWNTMNLPKGIYILHLQNEGYSTYRKIIKQ